MAAAIKTPSVRDRAVVAHVSRTRAVFIRESRSRFPASAVHQCGRIVYSGCLTMNGKARPLLDHSLAISPTSPRRIIARALLVGDRIDTSGMERNDLIAAAPLAFHVGQSGYAAIYRFGVIVLVGLTPLEEDDVLVRIEARVSGPRQRTDDETAQIEIAPNDEEKIPPGGPVTLRELSDHRFLVIADALAKSVALGRDERLVNGVFETIEPFAANLASKGRAPWRRRSMLKLIGEALLVQHRVSGRVAVEDKPDILWDRPDFERLWQRLNDEYELDERAQTLKRKLDVIVETARALTDVIEANRTTRLELVVILLIATEIVLSLTQNVSSWHSSLMHKTQMIAR